MGPHCRELLRLSVFTPKSQFPIDNNLALHL
jgi:hypothetical protein